MRRVDWPRVNAMVFATSLTFVGSFTLVTRLNGAHNPTHPGEQRHILKRGPNPAVNAGALGGTAAAILLLLAICWLFASCGLAGCCSCKKPPPKEYDEEGRQRGSVLPSSHREEQFVLQPETSGPQRAVRQDALQHVSEMGARPAPNVSRSSDRGARSDGPARDRADRLAALTVAHGDHGHSASQDTLVNGAAAQQERAKDLDKPSSFA
ncbi:hypothetical protein BKA62DRAFT_831177 [Auriculariales sp. MPI-PUGE-AT-0066]|nr:hypothetical protein BKA62DRAFT_831177 [Auriculariales sp. MPI-PUGE-AT-0066]